MKVEFRKSFEKDLGKIRDEESLARINAIIEEVENVGSLLDISNIKKLKADGDYYRIRIGDYRVGLPQDEGMLPARDASRLSEETNVAANAIAKRFGSQVIEGKIQAHIVSIEN